VARCVQIQPWRLHERLLGHADARTGKEVGVLVACNQESGALVDAIRPALFESLFPGSQPLGLGERYAGEIDLARFAGVYSDNVYHHGDPATGWRRRSTSIEIENLPD